MSPPITATVPVASTPLAGDETMECGVCWWLYDPSVGDDLSHTPPGTLFADLPDDWTCPECEAAKHRFLHPGGDTPAGADETDEAETLRARIDALVAAYQQVLETSMKDVPICHPDLSVEAIGFEPLASPQGIMGILITPWFLNLVILPDTPMGRNGEKVTHALPAGRFEFVIGGPDGFEGLQSCSLFSPMGDFADQSAARETAEHCLVEIMKPADGTVNQNDGGTPFERPQMEPSRRNFLRGRMRG